MACLPSGGRGGRSRGFRSRRWCAWRVSFLENVPLDATAHSTSLLPGSCLKCSNLYRTIHGSACRQPVIRPGAGKRRVAKRTVAVGE
jgi:hypothetical protein